MPGVTKPERRAATRYQYELPIALRLLHDPTLRVPALSRDIGSGGIFLYTNLKLSIGQETVVTLKLPRDGKKARLLGVGRVVRVEEVPDRFGLAVTIDDFALF